MANIYMNIKGYKPSGVATIKDPNGEVYMAVKSYAWGATRNVNMNVGNMNNRDSGIGSIKTVTITRELDGAANALLTSVFKFDNTKGKNITFLFTKPKKDGQGVVTYYKVELTNARIVSYTENLSNNAKPESEMEIAFTKIGITHKTEDVVGKLTEGAATIFDIPTGVLEAGQFKKD
ncbi:MAG: type VI secretion system tube protein Hcp [Succinivibrionaceae bacterium]